MSDEARVLVVRVDPYIVIILSSKVGIVNRPALVALAAQNLPNSNDYIIIENKAH
jgi:hypothetical protein